MNPLVTISVKRSEPSGTEEFQSYQIPFFNRMTLLVALRHIRENLDGTLGFRNYHCGRGVCTTCIVNVDGRVERACCFPLEEEKSYKVSPANDRVIKDLCVEL